jgi:MSHA biogenesis protein MshI
VHLAQVSREAGRPRVLACAFIPQTDITSSALEKICKEARVSDFHVTTLLEQGEYQLMMVDAPNVPVSEFKTAIRWRIKDMLNYHIDDATVDVLQVPTGKNGAERPQSVFAVASSNSTVKKRMELFTKANIPLGVIDIPELAQRNIASLFEDEGRALALLVFTDDGGLLTVTSDGELYLSRYFDITAGQLHDANEEVRRQHLERVELEVLRSLDYFGRQFGFLAVSRLLVAVPDGTGLEALLSENIGLPVARLDLAQVMDIDAVPALARSEFAINELYVLGAALRQEKRAL